MKEQNETPEKELNKPETSHLDRRGVQTLVIRELNGFNENFTKEIENIKMETEHTKNLSEIRNTLTEAKTASQGINSA